MAISVHLLWLVSDVITSLQEKSWGKIWWFAEKGVPLHRFSEERAFSSAGLEHLPYKQRVGGSNPSTPTKKPQPNGWGFFSLKNVCENKKKEERCALFQL